MTWISTLSPEYWVIAGLLLGLMLGSFANVCILRLPEKKSVVFPSSHCPNCEKPLRAIDNLPVLSYLFLKGRCHFCDSRISAMYPVVEGVTGLLMAGVFYRFGVSWECLVYAIVVPALVIITVIDLKHQIIPNLITYPGILFGLVAGSGLLGWQTSLLGFLTGGGLFYLLAELYFRMRGRVGLGGGDIKYIAAAGALLGWKQVLLVIFLASLIGAVFGTVGMTAKRLDFLSRIPFGPFLAVATLVSIFFGENLVRIYLGLILVN